MNTIRAIYDGKSTRVDFGVLDRLIISLRRMTGEHVDISDLLSFTTNSVTQATRPEGG